MLSFSKTDLENATAQYHLVEKQLVGVEGERKSSSSLLKDKSSNLEKLAAKQKSIEEKKKQLASLEQKIESVLVFQNCLLETQTQLRADLCTAVNQAMSTIWPTIYPYADFTSLKLTPSATDYSLELLAGKDWTPIEQASGGEKTCASLALRIAFAMV